MTMPVILYYRRRPRQRRADRVALKQQNRERDALIAHGATIIATFAEIEVAPPGKPEPRPILRRAYAAAVAVGANEKRCELAILRVDPIGRGDPLPMWGHGIDYLRAEQPGVSIRYLGCAAFEAQLYCEWLDAMDSAM